MKLKPKDIKRYNKIAAAGKKPIMVRVNQNWYTWLEGDPKYGVFLTTQSGRDIEFGWKQIDDIQEGVMKLTKSKLKEMVKEELLKETPKGNALWQKVVNKKVAAFVGLGKVNVSISVEVGPLHKQADKYAYRIKWELYGAETKINPLIFSDKLYDSADEAMKAGLKHYKKLKSKFRLST